MLYSIDSNSYVWTIPHREDFDIWRCRLPDDEYDAITAELASRLVGDEIQTAHWIPEGDWSGTIFAPIYTTACRLDSKAAEKFFGLILWSLLIEHEAVWGFGRYTKDSIQIDEGLTYFRLGKSP